MQLPDPPRRHTLRTHAGPLLGLIAAVLVLAGCPSPEPEAPEPEAPLAGTELRLTIVADPAMARSAERLRGEWNAQTGGRFSVAEATAEEVLAAASLPGDAVIVPSALLGPLAQRDGIAPVRPRTPSADPFAAQPSAQPSARAAARAAVFEALRRGEAVWGATAMGIPFGSPVLVCYYRADLLKQVDRRPPRTWEEYRTLACLLADANPGAEVWHGAMEPLGPGWAGVVLLARAAPYAKHPANYSVWFDIQTMAPLIAGPPFVRALEELVEAAKLGPAESLEFDPDAVRRAFWSGRTAMALSWPTAAAADVPRDAAFGAGFAELPGSGKVYNISRTRWDARPEDGCSYVPLLAIAGRLGVVSREAAHPGAAQELLAWLSGPEWSTTVSARSPTTTLFRREHLAAPGVWVEPPVGRGAAAQYAKATEAALGRRHWVTALRIPGRERYLAALDQAVHAAVRGEASPQEALDTAAASWRATTDALGADAQRTAYRRSLGLAD